MMRGFDFMDIVRLFLVFTGINIENMLLLWQVYTLDTRAIAMIVV